MAVAVVVMAGISCTLSGREMTIVEGLSAIWNHVIGNEPEVGTSEWLDAFMVWDVVMPRVVFAIVAGSGLAVCGTLMQGVMNNPLADPYTIGVSSGAVFGAVLAIVLGVSMIPGFGQFGIMGNAFLFGLVPIAFIMLLSSVSSNLSPVVIILMGIAISYFFSGITTIIMVGADEDALADAYQWQIGSFYGTTWDDVPLALAVTLLGIVFASLTYNKLNAMTAGDVVARTLGMDAKTYRMITLVIVTLVAATIVSMTGIIGFVGLVAPHMMRVVLGGNNRFVIPASMLAGSMILMFADIVTRTIVDIDVPVGAVMSFIGAPIFLYLIIGRKGGRTFS